MLGLFGLLVVLHCSKRYFSYVVAAHSVVCGLKKKFWSTVVVPTPQTRHVHDLRRLEKGSNRGTSKSGHLARPVILRSAYFQCQRHQAHQFRQKVNMLPCKQSGKHQ